MCFATVLRPYIYFLNRKIWTHTHTLYTAICTPTHPQQTHIPHQSGHQGKKSTANKKEKNCNRIGGGDERDFFVLFLLLYFLLLFALKQIFSFPFFSSSYCVVFFFARAGETKLFFRYKKKAPRRMGERERELYRAKKKTCRPQNHLPSVLSVHPHTSSDVVSIQTSSIRIDTFRIFFWVRV